MDKKVFVTGFGAVTPIGTGISAFWNSLVKGTSGVGEVTLFDTYEFNRHKAGEVKDFDPLEYIPARRLRFFGRASQFAIASTIMALDDAGIDLRSYSGTPAVIIGSALIEARDIDYSSEKLHEEKIDMISARHIVNIFAPAVGRSIGYFFGLNGVNVVIPCACTAGNYAIGYGVDLIRRGKADIAIVGGADSLSRGAFQGFQRLNSMAPDKCAPFDKNRKGMMLGEGAGILILESEQSVLRRRAQPRAEVSGYGISCDAYHVTIPCRRGIKKVMTKAMNDAGVTLDTIDYISAHGTGTSSNDREEAGAIAEIFGKRKVPVSSIKSMLTHCMGAASAIEAITCCLVINKGVIPPTINYVTPDPECPVDCVPNKARRAKVKTALNNSFAFGGNNCCVVFNAA